MNHPLLIADLDLGWW